MEVLRNQPFSSISCPCCYLPIEVTPILSADVTHCEPMLPPDEIAELIHPDDLMARDDGWEIVIAKMFFPSSSFPPLLPPVLINQPSLQFSPAPAPLPIFTFN